MYKSYKLLDTAHLFDREDSVQYYIFTFKLEILELYHENFDIHNENVHCTFEH